MVNYKIFLPVIFCCLSAARSFAQPLTFNKVTSPFGNFSGIVGGMAQDKNGYMWFATGGGLFRYDGYRFKMFSHDPFNKNSLSAQRLETIYIDRKGIIWIATWINGIDRFDPATGVFTHFQNSPEDPESLSHNSVRSFLEDRDGVLWVGTWRGLDRFDAETGKFKHFQHDPNDPSSISSNAVRKIYEDKEGTLWVGTGSIWFGEDPGQDDGGLNRFDKNTGKFTRYKHDPLDPHSLISNKVQGICEDSNGNFWIGTDQDGLHTMNRKTGQFERHLYDSRQPEKLSRPNIVNTSFGRDHITFINEDATGGIWIGTLGNGIAHYNPKEKKLDHYMGEGRDYGFPDYSGWSFCNSTDGILWIGTFQGGLYRVDPYHTTIPYTEIGSAVNAFAEDSDHNLWLGTSRGLVHQSSAMAVQKKLANDVHVPTSLRNNVIISLLMDQEETLWVGTSTGLDRFNPASNSLTRYSHDPTNESSIRAGQVVAVANALGDSLWVGTFSGLDLMNKRTGTFTHFMHGQKDGTHLTGFAVYSLQADKLGNLWVGTFPGGGVNYIDYQTKKISYYLPGITINSLLLDSNNKLWIGTAGDGIFTIRDSNSHPEKFVDLGSNLGGAEVLVIKEDNQKNIWVSTSTHGIFKINPVTLQATLFADHDNIRATNLAAPGHSASNGDMYFGGKQGYYTFSPNQIKRNPTLPQITFTDFEVDGRSIVPIPGGILSEPIETTQALLLNHNQNIFSISFAGIHFSAPQNNKHLYSLENFDHEWREAYFEKTADYVNVPPGRYKFKVKAASNAGVWSEKSMEIIVAPPWWRSWWVYALEAAAFVALAFGVHNFQKARVIKAEKEKTKDRELKQAREIEKAYHELKVTQSQLIQSEKMASLGELTAGIAHEIQNPLNFVNNFSDVNKELAVELEQEIDKGNYTDAKAIAHDIKDNEEKINHHGKRADAIVKSMLQHSRTSSGQKEPTDINALCGEYLRLAYHGLCAKDKSFNAKFETNLDSTLPKVNIIPQDLGRVILNLLNNAFYAVNERSKNGEAGYQPIVSVTTKLIANSQVQIAIKDNGPGIPDSIKDKIFQPFFTTKPTGQGTGLGLSLAYDIVKAQGGIIEMNSSEGVGTEFAIKITH